MSWSEAFASVIVFGIILRLCFIFLGSDSAQEKIGKAANWIVGLVMILVSWTVANKVWGGKMGNLSQGQKGLNMIAPPTKLPPPKNDSVFHININNPNDNK